VGFAATSVVARRTTDEHRASRRRDHSVDNASESRADRRFTALASCSNDNQVGSDLDGDVQQLLPGRAPPEEMLDVHSITTRAGAGDGVLELRTE
jgi:hypothetical protein